MQTQPTETAISPTAHELRIRQIVKRLVIDLGYIEHWSDQSIVMPDLAIAAGHIDDAISSLNEYLDGITPIKKPAAIAGEGKEISPVVYPGSLHED